MCLQAQSDSLATIWALAFHLPDANAALVAPHAAARTRVEAKLIGAGGNLINAT